MSILHVAQRSQTDNVQLNSVLGDYRIKINEIIDEVNKEIPVLQRDEISDFWNEPFWASIPDKPSTFPPSSHSHNDLYYTETELGDGQLDTRYYTETEINDLLAAQDEFLELSDTPGDYSGEGGKGIRVNTGATALEFYILTDTDELTKVGVAGVADYLNADYFERDASNHIRIKQDTLLTGVDVEKWSGEKISIGTPENGSLLQYWTSDGKWHDVIDLPPTVHTLASHSTKAHSELSDAPVDAHHSQLHAVSHEASGGDELNHDDLAGFLATEHVSLPNTMANVLSSYLLNDLSDVIIGTPENGDFLQYFSETSEWKNISDPPPAIHASTHHSGQGDPVNHDSLAGFLAAEHLSLPNTIANVLSNHTKEVHDALDIDARYIDGTEVVAATPSDGNVLTYVLANTRWEDKAPSMAHGNLTGITSDQHHDLLHASDHISSGSDELNHDSLAGFLAAEHLSLPSTIANVLSNHNKEVHDALNIDARYIDGKEVVAATPTDGHVLMYVLANTRWEDKPIGGSVALADLSDVNIGGLENGDLLEYWTSDSKWHNVVRFPDTIANLLSDHTKAIHTSLGLMPYSGGTFSGHVYARDHGSAATDSIVNVCYGTGNPPTPNTTTIGTLFVKYTA